MISFPLIKKPKYSSNTIMLHVIIALLPGFILHSYFFGVSTFIQAMIAILSAITAELLILRLRKIPPSKLDYLTGSLSALLLVFFLPPLAPWWVIMMASLFAVVIGKHLFGGIGMNIFNPAAVGFCIVYTAFPAYMVLWPEGYVNFNDSISAIFFNYTFDATTGSTLLTRLKVDGKVMSLFKNNTIINLAWILSACYLIYKDIINWRLSFSFLFFFIVLSFLIQPIGSIEPILNLVLGATLFGAIFIITDPTTSPASNLGKWVFGFIVALTAIIIRQYSHMPDSIAFAILFGNMFVPFIDAFTKPTYGVKPK